jgi:undecaprenyl-diphosphatase
LGDWVKIVGGVLRSLRMRELREDDVYARLGWLLVVGMVPAGIIGLLLQDPLRKLFASLSIAATLLIVNGVALLVFERLRQRPLGDYLGDADGRIAKLGWRQAIAIGGSQAPALIPGISRSGFAMGGGLVVGLSNEDSARYSFLLATPVILAAAKAPRTAGLGRQGRARPGAGSGLCAALTTFFAVKFPLRYFQTNRLSPFGTYCIGLGVVSTLAFAF